MYRLIFNLFLRRLPAEFVHRFAFASLRLLFALPLISGLCRRWLAPSAPQLRRRVMGLDFPSPVGLAAGFDKDAHGFAALSALGFGFVEVGTVTAHPQPGNPKPRLFRLPADRALVNRMGFNNHGALAAAARLARRKPGAIVGVNIGKTKVVPEAEAIADYEASAAAVAPFADYLVVNVSSPNTPGLRNLQAVASLRPLLVAVRATLDRSSPTRRVPLLVKIAPDLADADLDDVADLALELGLDGIIATNTTIARSNLKSPEALVTAIGSGGLSGAPVAARSLEVLRRLRGRVGDRLALISVGGIETAEQAWQRLQAGAALVQIYTGFIYGGPLFPHALNEGLKQRLAADAPATP